MTTNLQDINNIKEITHNPFYNYGYNYICWQCN